MGRRVRECPECGQMLNCEAKAERLDDVVAYFTKELESLQIFDEHLAAIGDSRVVAIKDAIGGLEQGLRIAKGESDA